MLCRSNEGCCPTGEALEQGCDSSQVTTQAIKERNERMKPLFIPLKGEYFDAFEAGTKDTEYRKYGPRWNCDTCYAGRKVTLSYGYGKKRRLRGEIVEVTRDKDPSKRPGWIACYGTAANDAICIKIKLDKFNQQSTPSA